MHHGFPQEITEICRYLNFLDLDISTVTHGGQGQSHTNDDVRDPAEMMKAGEKFRNERYVEREEGVSRFLVGPKSSSHKQHNGITCVSFITSVTKNLEQFSQREIEVKRQRERERERQKERETERERERES